MRFNAWFTASLLKEAHGKVGRVYNGLPHYAEATVQVHEEQDRLEGLPDFRELRKRD